jgi:phage regulator Rha-like protein
VKNVSGAYKKEKKELLDKLDALDKKAEQTLLTPQEIDLNCCPNNRLAQLLREEEVKLYQRAKTKHILQGDMNTKYFQLLANGKHRKMRIFQLQDEDKIIEGDETLKKYTTSYYKGLFGKSMKNIFRLDEAVRADIPQVTESENEMLTQPFTEEEVKCAIFQMEHNKYP